MRMSGTGIRESGAAIRSAFRGAVPGLRFAFAGTLLFLSSCVSVLPEAAPASARYLVNDVAPAEPASAAAAWTLGVDEPEATLAFNTSKIALSRAPARIEYYAGGEWVDRAPRLFGAALVRSFENAGAVRGVGSRVTLPVSTFVLQSDIRELTIIHSDGGLTAKAEVFARLTNGRSRIHASRLFSASEPVRADNAGAAAGALNLGLERIQREIVQWTIVEADRAAAN